MTFQPTMPVWRYMSFAKFVWMLQKKQLWLANVKFLDDKWELAPDISQINSLVDVMKRFADKNPTEPPLANTESEYYEGVLARLMDLAEVWRNETFVSCWNASEHESHALWRIYCPTPEGIAIQTTLDCLQKSVAPLPVCEVSYVPFKIDEQNPPRHETLAVQKRPMFAYEQEVRVVLLKDLSDPKKPNYEAIGTGLPWDPEEYIQNIWLHPESQSWFQKSVTEIVSLLAPRLAHQIWMSKMSTSPHF